MTYSDIKTQAKLNYLRRLLNIRVGLMQLIESVTVEIEGDMVHVTWYSKPGLIKKISFTEEIEFPLSHLSKRIEHYRRKVRTEFKNRHENRNTDI